MARSSARSWPVSLLLSLRPSQWTKNLVVFAGILFGLNQVPAHERAWAAARSGAAFGVFCVLAGVVYLINDVRDRDADARHPTKSRRPIAAGAITPPAALTTAFLLGLAALTSAFWLSEGFGIVAVLYVAMQSLYSASLKHVAILDVLVLATGFVMRAIAGAVVIHVQVSHWLLVLTFLLALFLALSKRRAELTTLAGDATSHRPSLAHYSPYLLDQMISVVTASTLIGYAFYTISPETVAKFGTDRLIFTIPFPLYGIFRYLYLVHQRDAGGSPSELLLEDRPLLLSVALWAMTVAVILYGPWR